MAGKSKQPRFATTPVDSGEFYLDVLKWVNLASEQVPKYEPNSRVLDTWLSEFWGLEPHLAGVINSVSSIDSNRGWSITGGRNQVSRWSKILHNWEQAPGFVGWRPGMTAASISYYTTNIGSIIELGRDGAEGPVRGFYHADPTRCQLSGLPKTPLYYYPMGGGKRMAWKTPEYMRMTSMPSIQERLRGLGYCALMRCMTLAQIMIAVYMHDKEQLGAQAPRGLLLLQGITEDQWETAMQSRKVKLEGEGYQYFAPVSVLASAGMEQIDAKLIALSQLPKDFNLQEFTSLLMYGYALCFGYDPSEFYPVQFGSLGRGTEVQTQHEKATSKGGMNFALTFQEQIQRPDILPSTLQYEFDERDDEGELLAASSSKAWVDVYRSAREAGLNIDLEGGISRSEFRAMLAEHDIIPREWTVQAEESEATDEDDSELEQPTTPIIPIATAEPETPTAAQEAMTRDRLLSKPHIWRVIDAFPDEPIVRYHYKCPIARMQILYPRAGDLLIRRVYRAVRVATEDVLYDKGGVTITEQDVDRAISNARKRVSDDYASLLNAQKWEGAQDEK